MPPKRDRSADKQSAPSKRAKTRPQPTGKVSKTQTKAVKSVKPKKSEKKAQDDLATSAPKGSWMIKLLTDPGWTSRLSPCFQTDSSKQMEGWVLQQYNEHEVFPPKELIFNAFNSTPFNDIKIVILGQDPYHDTNQAHGLSFSVPHGVAIPPSLRNIYKELATDIPGFKIPSHGCLESWTRQGVLLLNAALTVRAHEANSHARCDWWRFTDDVIRIISDQGNPCVFILWGGFAHKKEPLIDVKRHRIVKTAHPSPLSFNKFRGCKCFSLANDKLRELGKGDVDWTV